MRSTAAALGIAEESGKSAGQQVAERLKDAKALLVLDNFEQVLEAASEVSDLLTECPALEVLVTSRAVLNLSIEHEYAVPEMPIEDAVTLFVERARSVRAGFALDSQSQRAWRTFAPGWTESLWRWSWRPRRCGCCLPPTSRNAQPAV